MPHEVEVSWQDLRQIVQQWAGTSAELDQVTPMAGGTINTTLCLQTKAGDKAVLKITPHRVDRSYEDEILQLQLLRDAVVPVPQVYLCKIGSLEDPFSYLLMQFVDGVDLALARKQCSAEQFDELQTELAELVLRIHEQRSPHYMRVSASEPKRYEKWHECYRDFFDPIWNDIEKSDVLPVKTRKIIRKVHDRLETLLAHDDCPRLVHWDLWTSNILVKSDSNGRWRVTALLDPNCKYAHAEAEIAYLEQFHTITPAFVRVYQQVHKLAPEYHRLRKPVYHLYNWIDHLHLFGHEYLASTIAQADRLATLI